MEIHINIPLSYFYKDQLSTVGVVIEWSGVESQQPRAPGMVLGPPAVPTRNVPSPDGSVTLQGPDNHPSTVVMPPLNPGTSAPQAIPDGNGLKDNNVGDGSRTKVMTKQEVLTILGAMQEGEIKSCVLQSN